jgi:hypothetical protein
MEIEAVESTQEAGARFVGFEDGEGAAGAEDTMHFDEGEIVIGEVTKSEGGGYEVDGGVGDGEVHGVGFDCEGGGGGRTRSEAGAAAGEHGVREIDGEDGRCGGGTAAEEFDGERAGSAAEVDDAGVGLGESFAKGFCDAGPPAATGVGGEQLIEQVVAGGDGVEHFADGERGGGFIRRGVGAGGAGRGHHFIPVASMARTAARMREGGRPEMTWA